MLIFFMLDNSYIFRRRFFHSFFISHFFCGCCCCCCCWIFIIFSLKRKNSNFKSVKNECVSECWNVKKIFLLFKQLKIKLENWMKYTHTCFMYKIIKFFFSFILIAICCLRSITIRSALLWWRQQTTSI